MKPPLKLDRFEVGLPDPQEAKVNIYACSYDKCDIPIESGENVYVLDEDYYCSAACLHQAIGARKEIAI